jgi:hypothetical protein
MRKTDAYPGRYFKAENYDDDWELTVEIEMARLEEFDGGSGKGGKVEKLVTYFRKVQQGLVTGPVIFDQIADITGEEDSDDWRCRRVTLFRDWTMFGNKKVKCIRVKAPDAPAAKAAKKPKPKPNDGLVKPDFNDSVDA